MKNLKIITLLLLISTMNKAYFSQGAYSYYWTELPMSTPYTSWKDYAHFSIEKSPSNTFYATTFTTFAKGTRYTDIQLRKLDANGRMLWTREIDLCNDDRVLDVVIDASDNIILTGYTDVNSPGKHQLYIAKFSPTGVLINDFIVQANGNIVGTKIITSQFSNDYYIGGYESVQDDIFNMQGKAILISVDDALNKLNWKAEYKESDFNNTITDIVEIEPEKMFITGSVGKYDKQNVLACFVDPTHNGDVINDFSFDTQHKFSLGASAVYNPVDDQLWLLLNSTTNSSHSVSAPHIISIKGASTIAPYFGASFYLTMPNPNVDSYAGLKLFLSSAFPESLTIFGYKRSTTSPVTDQGQWSVDIEFGGGSSGANSPVSLWQSGYGAVLHPDNEYLGGTLSMFSQAGYGAPYFHSSDIATLSLFGNKYTSLTDMYLIGSVIPFVNNLTRVPAVLSSHIDLNLAVAARCLNRTTSSFLSFTHTSVNVTKSSTMENSYSPMAILTSPRFNPRIGRRSWNACGVSRTSGLPEYISEMKSKFGFKVHPNPFKNTLNLSSLGGKNIQQVKIVNNLGQEVYSKSLQNSSPTETIDVNEFAKGMYFVFITDETGEVFTSKIIKQ